MSSLRHLLRRMSYWLRRNRLDAELAEELAFHRAQKERDLREQGVASGAATMAARRALGNVTLAREDARGVWGFSWLDQVLADLRYTWRTLRRSPGFAAVAVLTLALGIGATTTLFSVAYGVLLRPLPWADPDRLIRVTERRQGRAGRIPETISNGTYVAWAERPGTIEAIGSYSGATMTLAAGTNAAEPERVRVATVTPSMFTVLKARPLLGRLFATGEGIPGQPGIVVLGFGLWQQRFGGRADIVGQTVHLETLPYTVVGVMPREFVFPDRETRAWTPISIPPVFDRTGIGRGMILAAMARLKPGATPAQAAAEATGRARGAPQNPGLAMALFGAAGPIDVTASPWLEALTADVRPGLLVLLVAVGLLLTTATANVASLQLARATTRRREMAIRAAIGAGTGRLTRQLLVESSVLSAVGGTAGLLLTVALHRALPSLLPIGFPRVEAVSVDTRVLAFAAVASMLASLVCGLAPAFHARRINLRESLSAGVAPVGLGRASRVALARWFIIAGQIAVSCVLLVGAALLGRSLVALIRADRGYEPVNLLTASLPMPSGYTDERRLQLREGLVERLRGQPGVKQAAFSNVMPLAMIGGAFVSFKLPSTIAPGAEVNVETAVRVVSAGYFEALGLRITAGRPLTESDRDGSAPVALVSESFSNKYLGGRGIGERIPGMVGRASIGSTATFPAREVVGIVEDVRQVTDGAPPQPEVFLSYQQVNANFRRPASFLAIRTDRDPALYVSTLKALVREQDASLAPDDIKTMEERVMVSLAQPRLYAWLLGGFAVFALAIVAAGLFGVLSYSVAQRSKEIAVRSALGATTGHIVGLVLRQAAATAAAGLAVGLWAAFVLTTYLSKLLYGVRPRDTVAFVAVAIVVLLTAAIACAVPAHRSARVDPLGALKT